MTLAVVQGIAAFGAGLIVPLLAPWLAGLEDPFFPEAVIGLPVTTELKVGILFSVFGIVRATFEIPMGRLSDRLGTRRVFLEIGLVGSAFSIVAYTQVGTVSGMISVRMFQGFALAISTPALMAMIEGITVHRTRGGSMGFFDTIRTLGWGIGPIAGGLISDLASMQHAFIIGGTIVFAAAIAVRLYIPDVRPGGTHAMAQPVAGGSGESNPDDDGHQAVGTTAQNESGQATVLLVFSSWRQATSLLGLSLAIVTLMMGFSAMIAMENPILDRIGGTLAGFGLIFAITTIVRLFLQFPIGVASDRWGRKRFIVWGLVANAPIVALMGFATNIWEFTLLRGFQGVALAGVIAPAFALAADIVDERQAAQQMGVVSAAFSVGLVIGPLLAGGVAFLGFAVPFVVAGALTLVGAVGVWLTVDEST